MCKNPVIGIYCVSSQSGRAFLADLLMSGQKIYGYARRSPHAEEFVRAVKELNGIRFERPANTNGEFSQVVPLSADDIGHDLHRLVWESDVIIIAEPSHYLLDTITELKEAGLAEAGTPVILSPPRTFAVPYLWKVLGTHHPMVCFSTNPYSCKAPRPDTAYIKRRKRCWFASLEGDFKSESIKLTEQLFPQAVLSRIPATTSIGNIGAVFHPTPYIMKYRDIRAAAEEGRSYSYYMEAIAASPEVSDKLGEIDQIRLQIADRLGLNTFGLAGRENEDEWQELMMKLRQAEHSEGSGNVDALRHIRSNTLHQIGDAVVSAQHWLDYTYGVSRTRGESVGDAIRRTPTYQKMSVPQTRYVEEDIPSSFLPMMMIAQRLGIDTTPMQDVMTVYYEIFGTEKKGFWRDLECFSDEYILSYLKGDFFSER